jgi:hypothetical protein
MGATIGLGRNRLALGRDLRLISADEDAAWLESAIRLRPGQSVELIGAWPLAARFTRARVVTWRITRLGAEGPIYRGCLRFER